MNKVIILILSIFYLTGCVAIQESTVEEPVVTPVQEKITPQKVEVNKIEKEIQQEPQQEVEEVEPEILKGIILGETVFLGVLEKRDVRLLFVNLDNPQMRFQFQIGDVSKQQILPWDVKPLDPGYFFIELPAGRYKIASVSILVGTTLATEKIDIKFDVQPDSINYLGTLQINGTKEKIKLGGLPVIQPGFEYTAEILDRQEEAKAVFAEKFPEMTEEMTVQLMQILTTNSK